MVLAVATSSMSAKHSVQDMAMQGIKAASIRISLGMFYKNML
jgi:hypothetical protein